MVPKSGAQTRNKTKDTVKNFMQMPSGKTMGSVIGKPSGIEVNGSSMNGYLKTETDENTNQYKKTGSLAADLHALNSDKDF